MWRRRRREAARTGGRRYVFGFMRSRDRRIAELAAVRPFSALDRGQLARLARLVELVTFDEGAYLAREEYPRPQFIVIADGLATATFGGGPPVILGPGDHCGELTVLDGTRLTPTVRAVTRVDAFVMGRREFWSVLHTIPPLAVRLVASLGDALRRARALDAAARLP